MFYYTQHAIPDCMSWKMVVFVAVTTLTKVLASAHTSNAPLVREGLGDDGMKKRSLTNKGSRMIDIFIIFHNTI